MCDSYIQTLTMLEIEAEEIKSIKTIIDYWR